MNSVDAEVEEILKTDPLRWERTTSGFITFLHGVSSMLNEALGAEYYAIVICNAPFERSTSVSICLFGDKYVRIAREEDVISSEENLMKIAEEHFYDEVERYKNSTSSSNIKADAVTNEQDESVIRIEVPAGKTIQIVITTKAV